MCVFEEDKALHAHGDYRILLKYSETQLCVTEKGQLSKITSLTVQTIFKIHIQNWHSDLIRHCMCAILELMTYFDSGAHSLRYKQLVPKGFHTLINSEFTEPCLPT